jgi:hypothetical protein
MSKKRNNMIFLLNEENILAVRKKNTALHPNFQWFVPKEAAYLK